MVCRIVTDFASDYVRIVGPVLKRLAKIQGFRVAWGDQGYSTAIANVMAEATRLGSSHLPEEDSISLLETVGDWVMEAIELAWSQIPPEEYDEIHARLDALDEYFHKWEEQNGGDLG